MTFSMSSSVFAFFSHWLYWLQIFPYFFCLIVDFCPFFSLLVFSDSCCGARMLRWGKRRENDECAFDKAL